MSRPSHKRRKHRALRIVGKVFAGIVIAILGLIALVELAFVGVTHTDAGRRRLLAIVLPKVNEKLRGHLAIGRLGGDLLHALVLENVELDDAEGVPAVRIRRLGLDWDALALVRHHIHVRSLEVTGLDVLARPLRDGKLNLSELTRPSPAPAPEPESQGKPWDISVDAVSLVGHGRYRDAHGPRAAGFVLLRGDGAYESGVPRARVDRLRILTTLPVAAQLDLAARAHETSPGGPVDRTGKGTAPPVIVDQLDVRVRTTGRQIERAAPSVKLRSPVEIDLHAAGGLDAIAAQLQLAVARGGRLRVDGTGGVQADGVHWRAKGTLRSLDPSLWRGVPRGRVEADFSGEGVGGHAHAQVARLDARVPGVVVIANGHGSTDGDFHAALHVDAPRLDRVRALPSHPSGSLRVAARVDRRHGHLSAEAHADGAALQVASVRVRKLGLDARLDGTAGSGVLVADGVRAGGRAIDHARVTVRSDGKHVSSEVAVAAPSSQVDLSLALHALLERRHGSVAGVDGSLDRLSLKARTARYHLTGPAHFAVARGAYRLDGLAIVGTTGRLAARGTYRASGAIAGHVELRDLDVKRTVELVQPAKGQQLPPTTLDLTLDASGTTRAPRVAGKLSAKIDELAAVTSRYRVDGSFRWAERRARVTLDAAAIEGGRIHLEAIAPTPPGPRDPIAARVHLEDVRARTLAHFVPSLAGTEGKLSGDIDARGTMDAPVVTLSLLADGITRGPIHDVDAAVSLAFVGQRLRLGVRATQGNGGAELASLEANLLLPGRTPRETMATLRTADPKLDARLLVRHFDLALLRLALPEAATLRGALHVDAKAAGTLRRPDVRAALGIDGLAVGKVGFSRAAIDARVVDGRAQANLALVEDKGGNITGSVDAGLAATAPLDVKLYAKGFDLRVLSPFLTSAIADLQGQLDAAIAVTGTREAPSPTGTIDLSHGSFLVLQQARRYNDVTVNVAISPTLVNLKRLSAKTTDGGTLDGHGTLALASLRPQKLDAELDAHSFAISAGGPAVGTLDGRIRAQGAAQGNAFKGTVTVDNSSIALPRTSNNKKKLQSTGQLQDVVIVDEKQKKPAKGPGMDLDFVVRIPGPFIIHGPEVATELGGKLDVKVHQGQAYISGIIGTSSGWIEVLGHRFQIDHARVSFDGSATPDPALDIRVTRQRTDALLWVDVSGTASSPHVDFGSDPAIYSESEILAMLISDDPQAGTQDTSLEDKVVGAISGVIVGKLKDQLAPRLPIDVLKVDVGGQQGVGSTRIEVGKYLTPKIYVSYVHQFGTENSLQPQNSNQATVEWRFARRMEVDTTFGDAAVGAADLYFTWRF